MKNITLTSSISALGVKTKKATWLLIYGLSDDDKKFHMMMSEPLEPTVADVLSINLEKHQHNDLWYPHIVGAFVRQKKSTATLHALRTALLEAGFTAKDSKFLYFGTRQYYIDDLMAKQHVADQQEAEKIISVAIATGWIKAVGLTDVKAVPFTEAQEKFLNTELTVGEISYKLYDILRICDLLYPKDLLKLSPERIERIRRATGKKGFSHLPELFTEHGLALPS